MYLVLVGFILLLVLHMGSYPEGSGSLLDRSIIGSCVVQGVNVWVLDHCGLEF